MIKLTIRIHPAMHERIEEEARNDHRSINSWCNKLFESALAPQPQREISDVYTYADSAAGVQSEEFKALCDIIDYIDSFGHTGAGSTGTVFRNGKPVLDYISSEDGLKWIP